MRPRLALALLSLGLGGASCMAFDSAQIDAPPLATAGSSGQGAPAGDAGSAGAGAAGVAGAAGAGTHGGAGKGGAGGQAGAAGAAGKPGAPGGAAGSAGGNPAGQGGQTSAGQGGGKTGCASPQDCDDKNPCNGVEVCDINGLCQPGVPLAIDDDDPCTDDACDPTAGVSHKPTSLDDGDACTLDACNKQLGVTHKPLPLGDGDPCTEDTCDPAVGVLHTPIANCGGCDPASGATDCDDGNPCSLDYCDKGCKHQPSPGASCSDGNVCNGTEQCDSTGACQPGAPLAIDDGDPCTLDLCDPFSGVTHPGVNVDDGNPCTDDACTGQGVTHTQKPGCSPCSVDPDCNDGNPCTDDVCQGGGCAHSNRGAGAVCGDASPCVTPALCDGAGVCNPGKLLPIDDGNPCTIDACDPDIGIVHLPVGDGAGCDDGNPCSLEDRCQVGACVGSPKAEDNNPCTDDFCDPSTGNVSHGQKPDGAPCEDGDPCTFDDFCYSGFCFGNYGC